MTLTGMLSALIFIFTRISLQGMYDKSGQLYSIDSDMYVKPKGMLLPHAKLIPIPLCQSKLSAGS